MAVILFFIMTLVAGNQWLMSLELKTVDARTHWFEKNIVAPEEIVLIMIDEASLDSMQSRFGRWPWPRKVFAEVIELLAFCGAKSVLLDILFTEQQTPSSPDSALSDDDQALVDATAHAKNTVHSAQFNYDPEDEYNASILKHPLPSMFIEKFGIIPPIDLKPPAANTFYLPFEALYMAAAGTGNVSITPDSDGVYRRLPLLVQYDSHLFPTLSLSPFIAEGRSVRRGPHNQIAISPGSQEAPYPITVDSNGQFFIKMYRHFDAYSFSGLYLSLMKIRRGILTELPVPMEVFTDKVVFIGASAAGVEDLKHTAIGPRTPGVYLHASAYGNLLSKDMLTFAPPFIQSLMIGIMILISVHAVFMLEKLMAKIALPLAATVCWTTLAMIVFHENIVLPMVMPSLAAVGAYVASISFLSFTEGRERRKIKNVLGQYVAPSILTKVLENSKEEFMRAEVGTKENLTLFFSDIRGFTSLAECHPVEQVVELLNGYLSSMTDIIFENNGTLDKFIGDAIVAFWGAPLRDDKHPIRAVRSALTMQKTLIQLNRENRRRHLPHLNVGIGIHTDDVILGNIGSHRKLDYTVIGDGVNLASRLEGLTKMYNTPILISQSTYNGLDREFCCRMVDFVKVKGKQKPIRIYSALGNRPELSENILKLVELTDIAFQDYVQRKFRSAEKTLQHILDLKPNDFLATMFLFRCREYQQSPPPEDWSGYYEYHTK